MRLRFVPGVRSDAAPVAASDALRWLRANNVRWCRQSSGNAAPRMESMPAAIAVVEASPEPLQASFGFDYSAAFDTTQWPAGQLLFSAPIYTIFPYVTPAGATGALVCGLNRIDAIGSNAPSAAAAPTFTLAPIQTFAGGDAVSLLAPVDPFAAPIQPFWWFVEEDDVIVGQRAGADAPWSWNKNTASDFARITNAPPEAVAGAVVNRILVLLGARSLTHPDPGPRLTVRWSDRFDWTVWTPSDVNLSGEMQVEVGSRIVGGGLTRFGVAVWGDRRLALLEETGDNNVFSRTFVDGATGLLGNRAWCEAAGRLWWLSPDRSLWVYDGGRARRVPCPVASVTLRARHAANEGAWFQMTPSPGTDEIWISYRVGSAGMNRTLIYNYELDLWYPATFFARPGFPTREYFHAFAPAAGGMPIMSAFRADFDPGNGDPVVDGSVLSLHDMPDDVAEAWEIFPGDAEGVAAAMMRPAPFFLESAPFALTDDLLDASAMPTTILPNARVNAEADAAAKLSVTLRGLAYDSTGLRSTEQTVGWVPTTPPPDYRVGGPLVQLRIASGSPAPRSRVILDDVWMSSTAERSRT